MIIVVDPLSVFMSLLAKTFQEVLQKRLGGLDRSTKGFTLVVESILSSHFENTLSDFLNGQL